MGGGGALGSEAVTDQRPSPRAPVVSGGFSDKGFPTQPKGMFAQQGPSQVLRIPCPWKEKP